MAIRRANAEWKGNLREGQGTIALESGAFKGPYSFRTRFEGAKEGTNPEELIGGAHAACFSMALGAALTQSGHPPTRIATEAAVHIDKVGDGFKITKIELKTEGQVPGIDEATFKATAQKAKESCPVSRALTGTEITLDASFVSG
jgi:osmotically inducible protein OsmC